MGALDQILEMKKKGISDEEIVMSLEEQGFSPKEINDGFNQAKIKSAVSEIDEENSQASIMEPLPAVSQQQEETPDFYNPKIQEVEQQDYPMRQSQEYYQEPYFQQAANYEGYPETGANNADIMIEIAEQVFSEKIKKPQKQIDEFNEFKILTQTKVENSLDRLKRIETMIDRLQIEILEKIGSYGENLGSIKKEMSMMQDSFGKMINPLADKIADKGEEKKEKEPQKKISKKRK